MEITLPIYNGPKITFTDGQKSSRRKAGPAPRGWKYLKVGDRAPKDSIVLTYDGWRGPDFATGEVIRESSWLRAVPVETEYVGSETDFLRLRILTRNSKKVEFAIDSQRGRGFDTFKASNGVEIDSMCYPEVCDRGILELFVRGSNRDKDNDKLTATVSQFRKISVAVHEFNAFKRQPAKVDLSARVKELEKEVADLKAFKAGVEALLRKKA